MSAFDLHHMLELLDTGHYSDVIAVLEPVVEQTPAHLTAQVLLAQAYEGHERWSDALQTWEQARFLFPNSPAIAAGIQRVRAAQTKEPIVASEPSEPPDPASAPSKSPPAEPSEDAEEEPAKPDALSSVPSEVQQLAEQGPTLSEESDNELDHLIQELESARIEPDPELDSIPSPDLDDDIDDMVSETLARIYTSQEQYGEAARVYVKLATQDPDRAEEHLEKAAEMRARADEQQE